MFGVCGFGLLVGGGFGKLALGHGGLSVLDVCEFGFDLPDGVDFGMCALEFGVLLELGDLLLRWLLDWLVVLCCCLFPVCDPIKKSLVLFVVVSV